MKESQQPIIIIGMHRSGTSMLTGFISNLGVFMGRDKSMNDESVFFQRINDWLLYQFGATWDNPLDLREIEIKTMPQISEFLQSKIKSLSALPYFGLSKYIGYKLNSSINYKWGWKDPRNSLLLDFYKEIYPNAKIVHIYRNPVDVALSLRSRENKFDEEFKVSMKKRIKSNLLIKERIFCHSPLVKDLEYSFNLWKMYTSKALEADSKFKDVIHINYEDFLKSPKIVLTELSEYLELNPDQSILNSIISKADYNRAFAFRKDPQAVKFYKNIKDNPLVKRLNYHNLI